MPVSPFQPERSWTKTSGFHEICPDIEAANGTLIVGDVGFKSVTRVTTNEFAPASVHWIELDAAEVIVTLNLAGVSRTNLEQQESGCRIRT